MEDRLYRSRSDRMIAGVAGGLAERYDLDPSLVRIAWALVILFTGGLLLLLYIVMAIVVPEEPIEASAPMAMGMEAPMTTPMPDAGTTSGSTPQETAAGGAPQGAPATDQAPPTAWAPLPGAAPAMSARDARRAARRERRRNDAPIIFGVVLVIVGIVAFAGQVFPQIDFDLLWPIAIIVLGVALLVSATRRSST